MAYTCVSWCVCTGWHVCWCVYWCVCMCARFQKLLIGGILSGWQFSGFGPILGPQACVCPSPWTWFFISKASAPQDWISEAVNCNYWNVHVCLYGGGKNKSWNSLPAWVNNLPLDNQSAKLLDKPGNVSQHKAYLFPNSNKLGLFWDLQHFLAKLDISGAFYPFWLKTRVEVTTSQK